ncbi:phytoene desaturase family protein [Truepera radiovictrix]|uniref:Phytoene desaturase n=1 Tax=Truepera radiovictrix (strain DSM 17093 / CIP 108686 / LMG 22925 / RQ-24) TaxID=649638 RepID=D7CS23_TRURR|nr:phytoene desaturase [Truepera radiovictrix DSM 17093]
MSAPKTALVLGGGFAGLSAALHLALAGLEVTLVEREPEVGGKAGEFAAGGFRFDLGPSVWTLPEIVTELFARAGETPPVFWPLSPLCRYLYPSGRVWDVFKDAEATTAQLTPHEARAYRRLVREARALYEAAAPTFLFGHAPGPRELLRYALGGGLRAHPGKRLPALLRQFGATGDLEPFFLRFATYFGADPTRAPAVLHNIAWVELGLGVFYPVGGIKGVVRRLAALAEKLGVALHTGVHVERLEVQSGRVAAAHTSAGVFAADVVVSGLDLIRTHRLLGRRSRAERREPSLSGFVLLLGLEGKTPGLAHHNILFPHDYRAEFRAIARGALPADPTLYVSISSKSEVGDAPPGCENWFVLVNAPALPEAAPAGAHGGEGYAEHLLGVLARRGLDVRERVRVRRVLPPAYLARFAHRGAIYGAAPHSLAATLRPKQTLRGVRNLVLANGTVHPGGGIPLALLSGRHAAALVLAGRVRR